MQPQERPSQSPAKVCIGIIGCSPDGISRTLPPAPAMKHAGSGARLLHQLLQRRREGKKRWRGRVGWSEVTVRTQEDRDGLERGSTNPRQSRQVLRVRGADSCGLRTVEKS